MRGTDERIDKEANYLDVLEQQRVLGTLTSEQRGPTSPAPPRRPGVTIAA